MLPLHDFFIRNLLRCSLVRLGNLQTTPANPEAIIAFLNSNVNTFFLFLKISSWQQTPLFFRTRASYICLQITDLLP